MSSSMAHALRESPGRERVRYFTRQLITADDLTTEQEHFREKLRRHNRLLHGWGVVCGLNVTAAPTADTPWRVHIGEGYALSPHGDEIYVSEPGVCLDLAQCGPQSDPDPCEPAVVRPRPLPANQSLFVAIRYVECPTRPVRVSPSGCGCDEAVCENTRIRDSFEIQCLTDPPAFNDGTLSLCALISSKQIPVCPPCPDEPWVVLARASLPKLLRSKIAASDIDTWTDRRMLLSTAALQEQLVNCCCLSAPPATVTSIVPPNNKRYSAGGDPKPTKVSIKFDKKLKPGTVTVKTVLVSISKDGGATTQPVAGKVTYDPVTLTAQFTPDQEFPAASAGPDYIYTVTVKGDGPNRIRDVDGLALDGDKNGSPGGTFTSKFSITLSA